MIRSPMQVIWKNSLKQRGGGYEIDSPVYQRYLLVKQRTFAINILSWVTIIGLTNALQHQSLFYYPHLMP